MNLKKIISGVVTLSLLLSCLIACVSVRSLADEEYEETTTRKTPVFATVYLTNVESSINDIAKVGVKLKDAKADAGTSFSVLSFDVRYDSKSLEFMEGIIEFTPFDRKDEVEFEKSTTDADVIHIKYYNKEFRKVYCSDVANLYFKVKDNFTVSDDGKLFDLKIENVKALVYPDIVDFFTTCHSEDGSILIPSNNVFTGIATLPPSSTAQVFHLQYDINSDGAVNAKDILVLRKYLAGYSVTIYEAAADIYYDGAINAKDVLTLRKIVAGY